MLDDYLKFVDTYGLNLIEISDGSMYIPLEEKLSYISRLSKKYTVLSEVGSKQKGIVIPPDTWVKNMKAELESGSWKVIGEARESGTIP